MFGFFQKKSSNGFKVIVSKRTMTDYAEVKWLTPAVKYGIEIAIDTVVHDERSGLDYLNIITEMAIHYIEEEFRVFQLMNSTMNFSKSNNFSDTVYLRNKIKKEILSQIES